MLSEATQLRQRRRGKCRRIGCSDALFVAARQWPALTAARGKGQVSASPCRDEVTATYQRLSTIRGLEWEEPLNSAKVEMRSAGATKSALPASWSEPRTNSLWSPLVPARDRQRRQTRGGVQSVAGGASRGFISRGDSLDCRKPRRGISVQEHQVITVDTTDWNDRLAHRRGGRRRGPRVGRVYLLRIR